MRQANRQGPRRHRLLCFRRTLRYIGPTLRYTSSRRPSCMRLVLTFLLMTVVQPALAINRCTGPDGRTTYQETPCSTDSKSQALRIAPAPVAPAAARVPSTAPALATGLPMTPTPMTEAQKLEAQIAALRREGRKRSLEDTLLPNAMRARDAGQRQCDAQLAAIRNRKLSANNNLAGATYEQSLSQEMSAVVARCDTFSRNLTMQVEDLKRECSALDCTVPTAY